LRHPHKKRTPIPLAHLASGRAPPAIPATLGLSHFLKLSQKTAPGGMCGDPAFPSPFLQSIKKCAKPGPGLRSGLLQKSRRQRKKGAHPSRANWYPSPRATSPGLCFVPVFAISLPTPRLFPKPYRRPGLVVSSPARKNRAKIKPRREGYTQESARLIIAAMNERN